MPEQIKIEQKNGEGGGLLRDFAHLSELDRKVLALNIERSGGLIRIFVHPYYEVKIYYSGDQWDPSDEEKLKMERAQKGMERILNSSSEKVPPLFIMEEEAKVDSLKAKIRGITHNYVYIVPTHPDTSRPALGGTEPRSWSKLREMFKNLGVKKIIIGGLNLEVETHKKENLDKSSSDEFVLLRCVGSAINTLSRDFEVEVSNFASPDSRREYSEAKKEGQIQ